MNYIFYIMKFLSIILTSSKFDLLVRCLKSVINQRKVNFEYKIIVNVNTLNEDYYKLVLDKIPKFFNLKKSNIEIVRTESNGRPGKGHNSCLKLFKEKKEYDYLTMIDGDDLYYPVAFQRFELFLKKYPNLDLLHLMLNDRVHFQNEENYNYKSLSLNYKLISGFVDTQNWWRTHKMDNPFIGRIADNKTPSRILLCSRNIFNTTHPIKYSENARLYDDYLAFCSFYEAQLKNEINTYSCSDTYIYFYNSLNDFSVSYRFKEKDHNEEQNVWNKETEKYINVKKDNWNIGNLPYAIIENPKNYYILDKIKYAEEQVVSYELQKNQERYKDLLKINSDDSESTFDKVEFNLLYLIKSGIDTQENIINITKLYLKKNLLNQAFYQLFKLEQYPTKDNYEYIFNFLYNCKLYDRLERYIEILSRFDDVSENILEKIKIVNDAKILYKNRNLYRSKNVNIALDKNKKTLIYYTGYSGDFNGKNYGEKNVYGSELAAIKLCEKLKNKYNVIVLCETTENILHNGVYYINYNFYNSLITYYEIEYFIVSRFTNVYIDLDLTLPNNVYFILHDARPHNQYHNIFTPFMGFPLYYNFRDNFKKQFFVSKWQKENHLNILKRFDINMNTDNFEIIGNGIDTSINKNNPFNKKDPYKFIYCSNPNRGLLPLCKILIKLHKKYPQITLDIYFNDFNDDKIKKYIRENDFIKFHGKISNTLLWEKLSKSTFWIYPNLYSHETFCIACLEAMNNKNVVITRNFSALPELVNDNNLLIPLELSKEEDIVNYTYDKLNKLMNNRNEITNIQNKLYKRSLVFDWNNVYEKLISFL